MNNAVNAAPPPSKAECNLGLQAALVNNLGFGDYDGSVAGTIIVDVNSNLTTTLAHFGGTVSAAEFDVWNNVTGCQNRNITITVPTSATINTTGGSMTITSFTQNPANKFKLGGAGPGFATRVSIGATLNSAAGQTGGAYTGPFSVDFSY